jgi:hypothetical protein
MTGQVGPRFANVTGGIAAAAEFSAHQRQPLRIRNMVTLVATSNVVHPRCPKHAISKSAKAAPDANHARSNQV